MTPTPEQIEGYCQKGIAELNQVQAMTPTEAAAILRRYNEWRLGGPNYEYNSAEITEAIYVAIRVMEELGEPATGCNEMDASPTDDQLNTIRREAFHAGREQKGEYNTNSGNYEFEPLYPTAGDYINSLKKEDEEC